MRDFASYGGLGPSEIFRRNLRKLAKAYGMDFDDLAGSLKFIREEKKWLRKLWRDGLARYDKRTSRLLKQVATCLGLADEGDFWKPDLVIEPTDIFQANFSRWTEVIKRVREHVEALHTLRSHFPSEMRDIQSRYKDEDTMFAYWVAREFPGIEKDVFDDAEELKHLLAETEVPRSYLQETRFRERVLKRAKETEEWPRMFDELLKRFGEPRNLCSDTEEEIEKRLTESISRHPTEEEVFARFFEKYLLPFRETTNEPERGPTASDEVELLIEELRLHRNWQRHLDLRFDGSEIEAREEFDRLWAEYRSASNEMPSRDAFAAYYRSKILDAISGSEDAEQRRL